MKRLALATFLGILAATAISVSDAFMEDSRGRAVSGAVRALHARVTQDADAAPPNLDRARALVAAGSVRKDDVLAWPLVQLADTSDQIAPYGVTISGVDSPFLPKAVRDLGKAQMLRMDEGRVQVFVESDEQLADVAEALRARSADVQRVSDEHGIIQAWVPASDLRGVPMLPGVSHVRLPDYGVTQVGSVTTQGDALLNANDVRSTFGVDGSGVRVGVISDGVGGLAASQASGDLPAVDTTTCNIVGGNPGAGGSEGTAMLEIVHDIAPGATLLFGNFWSGTELDFMAAVNCLAANADVVVDDIGFYNNGAYDGSSPISMNATNALNSGNPIKGYYNAVGNGALSHYEERYANSGTTIDLGPGATWDVHQFQGTSLTNDAGFGFLCDATPGVYCGDTLLLPPGAILSVNLQWNDPFGASANDYDLFVLEEGSGQLFPAGVDEQNGDDDPVEFFGWVNDTSVPQFVDIIIGKYSGATRTLDMFVRCDECITVPDGLPDQPLHNFNTPCSSVSNNSDAGGGVVSLGAIEASDPGTNDIEPFSSCGPTNDGRLKPEAAAIDGVSITGAGGFSNPFYGTSAAAPHAAGIAALFLDCNPGLTRDGLRNALLNNAVDLGAPGADYDFGHGRLDAYQSAVSVGCSAGSTPTPTEPAVFTTTPTSPAATAVPTATPTRTPTRTPTPTSGGTIGDTNCNGAINAIDAALILQWVAALLGSLACQQNADANENGIVDVIDATLILQYAAGLLSHLPP